MLGSKKETPHSVKPHPVIGSIFTANLFATRVKKEVFLKADAGVPYGDVVKAMAEINGAGIERLGMVTEPAQPRAN